MIISIKVSIISVQQEYSLFQYNKIKFHFSPDFFSSRRNKYNNEHHCSFDHRVKDKNREAKARGNLLFANFSDQSKNTTDPPFAYPSPPPSL